jgi:hypothetical protein
MRGQDKHESEVWRACLAEPNWQALLRENDRIVIGLILAEQKMQRLWECVFEKRLTLADVQWLRSIGIKVFR